MDGVWQDLSYATRMLVRNRGFAATAVLTLAIGVGATTVVFSAIDSIVLSPFPYKNQHELATFFIHDVNRPRQDGRNLVSAPEFLAFRDQNSVFADLMAIAREDFLYSESGETRLVDGCLVTPNAFQFYGVSPLIGRLMTPEDATPGAPPVLAMSDRLWSGQFSRDSKILTAALTLNQVAHTPVAVMPPRFLPMNCDVWIPIQPEHVGLQNTQAGVPLLFLPVGRLKPGVSLRTAATDLEVIARRLSQVYPKEYPPKFTTLTKTLSDFTTGNSKGMLYALMAAVTLLLLIGCSNVANLLLAKATTREREIAVRASLGASRGRLIRQLLTESLLLSLIAGVVGCMLAYVGLQGLAAAIPAGFMSPSAAIEFRRVALAFAVAAGVATTVLGGLAPAIHLARGEYWTRLTGTAKGFGGGSRYGRLCAALVVGEVALAILLLVGAGLMMRTVLALQRVDLGFTSANILVARLAQPQRREDTPEQKRMFFRQVLDRVTALPGIVAATEVTTVPPFGGLRGEVTVPGTAHTERWEALLELISEGYFDTLGRPMVRGRKPSQAEVDSGRRVAVINQLLANSYFRETDPVGRTIKFHALDRFPNTPHDAYFEIIGVVRDAKNQGVREAPMPEAFLPYTITGALGRGLLVRTTGDPLSLVPSVRRVVSAVDVSMALAPPINSVDNVLQQFVFAGPRFGAIMAATFAGIGLVLVIIGVFSVMAYSVSLQTHEIGIRMALGAEGGAIFRMLLTKGLRMVSAGALVGVLASVGATRLLRAQVWGVSTTDASTFVTVVAVVAAVGLAACLLPARRATQVDPLVALRYE